MSTNACIYSALSSLSTLTGNSPLFREDNSSLTLGRDHRYHFVFTIPEDQLDLLPDRLVHQALAIAQRTARTILKRKGRKGLIEKK